MTAAGVRLDGVSACFTHSLKGTVYAVRDVSLDVAPGELMTLLGPSGCGKTTTLRIVAGFQEPSAGRIFIGERDVTQVMANDRNIGFVFQNYALFPHLNVFENVAYGLRVKQQEKAEIERAVGDVLALVGLAAYERQMPHQLSGGEQQRVALARAIVIKPRLLLFDEPLSNLDAKLRVQMRGEIRRLQKTLGITTLYVTHDQEEAMAISDRIAVMDRGEVVQVGDAEMLYRQPASVFVAQFIGRSNLIDALVAEVAPDRATLDIQGHAHLVTTAAGALKPGMTVRAVVRPEAVMLRSLANAGGLRGTILSRTYLGEKVEYAVRIGTQSIQAVAYNPSETERFAPGESVTVILPSSDVALLIGEGG